MSPAVRITQANQFDGQVYEAGQEVDIEDPKRAALLVGEGNAEFIDGDGNADETATLDALGRRANRKEADSEKAAQDSERERKKVPHANGRNNDGHANGGIPPADPDAAQGRAEENAAVTAVTAGADSGPPSGDTRAPTARAEKDSAAEPGAVGGQVSEYDALKAEATALGIEFPGNVAKAKLTEDIAAAKAAKTGE